MESPEPSADEKPTEEGRKDGEVVCAYTDWWEGAGRWRGSLPGKAEPPKSGLQKRRGRTL